MLVKEGKFSAICFLFASLFTVLLVAEKIFINLYLAQYFWGLSLLYFIILTVYVRLNYSGYLYDVGVRSLVLGGIFSFGTYLFLYSSTEWKLFGIYACIMSFFHYSEFLTIAWCNPKTLSISSFLLNHSVQYNIAAIASWLEFTLEVFLLPGLKSYSILSFIGFGLCIFGEIMRKIAMITGSSNFTHIVQTTKSDHHELVTHGIYRFCRHPSYVGWFYWSIGTQILLLNPVCSVAYAIVSWRFFNDRITHEEYTLLYFFGQDYIDYQRSVGTGLPWIKGFLLKH